MSEYFAVSKGHSSHTCTKSPILKKCFTSAPVSHVSTMTLAKAFGDRVAFDRLQKHKIKMTTFLRKNMTMPLSGNRLCKDVSRAVIFRKLDYAVEG